MKKVFILLKASTNEALEPTVLRLSEDLEVVKAQFFANIAPFENEKWSKQCLSKEIREDVDWYESILLVNHKGWGAPYVVKYSIQSMYI